MSTPYGWGDSQDNSDDVVSFNDINLYETPTGRMYNNKPTYTKLFKFTLASGDTSTTSIELGIVIDSLVAFRGFIKKDNGRIDGISFMPLSVQGLGDTSQLNCWFTVNVTYSMNIYSDGFGGASGEFWIEYTKI